MNDTDTPAEPRVPSPHPLASELAARFAAPVTPRILLLGYGSGRNVPTFLEAGARVDIVEDDPRRADAAAERFAADPRVRVIRARYDDPGALPGDAAAHRFDGALSTHALLHGTPERIAAAIGRIRAALVAGAPFFLTLGSKNDPRFGVGRAAGTDTFAPEHGSEAGIAHAYFDAAGVRALLRDFTIEAIEESSAAETAGAWAHTASETETLRHWFVRARTSGLAGLVQ